jgi:hypothetical protein
MGLTSSLLKLTAVPLFRVKVTASYGPLTPSLVDLSGKPPPGYDLVAGFISNGRPRGWFVEQNPEFSPPLLVVGAYYDVEASAEWPARAQARGRFAGELKKHGLPMPPQPIYAELADS